ncbi:MAG: hypothetical protein JNM39_14280 [Bdellovibrionaceae bacterium]|nr:hypothetical protein [Pseudobdellovibrionaceae bacterium]
MEGNIIGQSEYEQILDLNSKNIETYQGLYNTVNMSAALVRSQLSEAQLKQKARLYQWDSPYYQQEALKRVETMKKQTEVFVSFYTPEKKHDDLHKNQTLWKIFLDAGGKRYEGKAQKVKLLTSEVQGLYPFHNRFATPYTITFPVPTTALDGKEAKLTITGSVGSVAVVF